MKNWYLAYRWKEYSWNSESPMSKIWEIKKILEPTQWDSFSVKILKTNLLQLIKDWNYVDFQKKIGMPNKLCDWLLWTTSLNYLINYIIWIEDNWDSGNIVSETIKYIWNVFKYGKINIEEIPEPEKTIDSIVTTPYPSPKIEKQKERIDDYGMFWDIRIWDIESYPTVKNNETDSYCCSKTARLNGLHFGISLPRWNAYSAWALSSSWVIETIPKEQSWKKPNNGWWHITKWEFDLVNNTANFADIYAESSSSYGHRAIAIRDSKWERFVLDPYVKINGKKSLKPIKLIDYITKWRKILKAHFYHSNGYMS